jgi:hydrogenase maturation factor
MTEEILEKIWDTIHREAEKLGIAIVSGHTARYAGCNYPMVGGATIMGVDHRSKLVDPRSVQVGDVVIVTKGPAVETTGLMSVQFPEFIEEAYDAETVKQAQDVFYQMSVVKDCALLSEVGGVHAMHDATECGVWGGLYEMAEAGNYGLKIYPEKIIVQDVVAKVCQVFDIDPFKAISEGTLIAVVAPGKADEALKTLAAEGIPASVVGEVTPREEGTWLLYDGRREPLEHPGVDPFWIRFEEYLAKQQERKGSAG